LLNWLKKKKNETERTRGREISLLSMCIRLK
jgi:hypothetical protein